MTEFNSRDFEKQKKEQEAINKLIDDSTSSMKSFASAQLNSIKLGRMIHENERKILTAQKKYESNKKRINELEEKQSDIGYQRDQILEDELKLIKQQNTTLSKQIPYHQKLTESYKKQHNLINKSVRSWEAVGSTIKNSVLTNIKKSWSTMSDFDDSIRKTQLSMGILSNQSQAFAKNIFRVSSTTQKMGVNAKDLAGYQKNYSNEIGRSVILSEQGLIAMSQIAAGTTLGSEGASELVGQMDNFGISASRSRDFMSETVNLAQKMGTNSNKVTKLMLNNLKMAQKYSFKGGVRSMIEMANNAVKFKLNIEAVAGFAEKLFSPEGAIDAASQLQTLGGEWSKLADPFKLMYQARHDMTGLHKSIIEATSGVAIFNKETGNFDISGMELHRLREIAKVTGIEVNELATSAKELAKHNKVKTQISADIDPKYHDFISSMATFDDKGNVKLNLFDGDNTINKLTQLNNGMLKRLSEEQDSLEKRAMESKSFNKVWDNLKESFKATLLPFLKGVELGLRDPLMKFINWMNDKNITEKMAKFSSQIGVFATSIGRIIADNPFTSFATTLGAIGLFEYSKWYLNGKILGAGFKSVVNSDGTDGNISNNKTGRKGLSGKTKAGVGIGAGLGSTGLSMYRSSMDDQDKESTLGKSLGIASSGLAGVGIGSIGGIPGMIAGGIIGLGYGAYSEYGPNNNKKLESTETKQNDFVMRPGSKAQPFSENDTLIGFKPGGPIDKISKKKESSGNIPTSIEVSFKPIKIDFGTILLKSENNNEYKLDLNNDPILAREIASLVQQELRKAIGGGKLNTNPI